MRINFPLKEELAKLYIAEIILVGFDFETNSNPLARYATVGVKLTSVHPPTLGEKYGVYGIFENESDFNLDNIQFFSNYLLNKILESPEKHLLQEDVINYTAILFRGIKDKV